MTSQDSLVNDQKTFRSASDERGKGQDKDRTETIARDKKVQDTLDKLIVEREELKKKQTADEKKPGSQAVLDALK